MIKSLDVTYYRRPDGKTSNVKVYNIDPETRTFFINGQYKVSMEELIDGNIVLYARPNGVDEEDEQIVIGNPVEITCEELFFRLACECKQFWGKG